MKSHARKIHSESSNSTSYVQLVEHKDFKKLLKMKSTFIVPTTIFFLVFYFILPILASYTKVLEKPAFYGLNWAWIYALMQFVVVWIAGIIYMNKAKKYDQLAASILNENKGELNK